MLNFIRDMPGSYKGILIIYCVFFTGLFSPFLFLGEVVAPHRQSIELRAPVVESGKFYSENRKFNDYSNSYIPEISEALSGNRSSWLTLWAPKNELGRPLQQLAGFTPAYFPSWILAHLVVTPWEFITVISLLTCFVSGVFVILLFRELGIYPTASLVGGISLAASPFFMYWLTFPMFPATWCWMAGALWGMTRLSKNLDLLGWIILAFSIYSLGMAGYPQPVVHNAYIVLGYAVFLAKGHLDRGWNSLGKFLFFCFSAAVVGTLLVFPVYIDLLQITANSSRVSPPPSFFSMYLPQITGWDDGLRFVALTTFPEIFGSPISSSYPFGYDGLSITIVLLFFSLLGLFGAFRKTWGWWLAVAIFFILTLSRDFYEFGAIYLGFNLSPLIPLGSIFLPLIFIAVIGANELIICPRKKYYSFSIVGAIFTSFFILSCSLFWGITKGVEPDWYFVLLTVFVLGLLALQAGKYRPWLVIFALAIVTANFSYPLMLRQSPDSMVVNSPLVEAVRKHLSRSGGRFAIVDSDLKVLPPNLNATLGLASIHSYNSLSSLRYQRLIGELGGDPKFLGRWNSSIAPDYNSPVFWMSDITLILAAQRLNEQNLNFLEEVSGVYLHSVKSSIGSGVQVLISSVEGGHNAFTIGDPRGKVVYSPVKKNDQGDLFDLDLAAVDSPSLLILSQKYHHDWRAEVLTESARVVAETAVVNGVFQGVVLPPQSSSIRMEFKPYARYAWVGHVFWLAMFALMVLRILKLRHRVFSL